jgi:hypothetical protein
MFRTDLGKLTPLGDPAPNAPKWFAAVEMIRLAADEDWLHKATKEISKFTPGPANQTQTPKHSPTSNQTLQRPAQILHPETLILMQDPNRPKDIH